MRRGLLFYLETAAINRNAVSCSKDGVHDAGDLSGQEQVGRVDEDADDQEDAAVEQAHLVGVQDVQGGHQAVLGVQPLDVGEQVLHFLHLGKVL